MPISNHADNPANREFCFLLNKEFGGNSRELFPKIPKNTSSPSRVIPKKFFYSKSPKMRYFLIFVSRRVITLLWLVPCSEHFDMKYISFYWHIAKFCSGGGALIQIVVCNRSILIKLIFRQFKEIEFISVTDST